MIVGVGIDIIEVERVAGKLQKGNGFKEKVFSPREISLCDTKTNPNENYAARFAAKEAFLKATGLGLTLSNDLYKIEILNDDLGRPYMELDESLMEVQKQWNKIHVSMSHVAAAACAVVILEL